LPRAMPVTVHGPVFLDMRVVLCCVAVFAIDDDGGVAAAPVIMWSRSSVYVVCLLCGASLIFNNMHNVLTHC
jgi:hypothetical protein